MSAANEEQQARVAAIARIFYRRQLAGEDGARVQIRFDAVVLQRYIEAGHWVKRTDTVGRVKTATWSIDFGIGEGAATIHANLRDLLALPEKEREHWAAHVAESDLSENFLKMQLNPGSCLDDGDLRDWDA